MQKGKFGFLLWLYPYIALWSLFVWDTGAMLICLALALFAIAVEQNEWCTKQCLKTVMLSVYWGLYNAVMGALSSIPVAGYAFSVIDTVITIVMLVVIFLIGMRKLPKGEDISIPGKKLVEKAFGYIQQYAPAQAQQAYSPQPAAPQPAYPQPQTRQNYQESAYQQQPVQPFSAPPAPPAAPASSVIPQPYTPPSAPSGFTPPPPPPPAG